MARIYERVTSACVKMKAVDGSVKMVATPFWYAVGGFFATPLLVVFLAVSAVFFTLIWPLIPVLLYWQRRDELRKQKEVASERG